MEPETQKDGGLYWSDMEPLTGLSAEDTLLEFPFKETMGLLSLCLSLSLSLSHTHTHTHTHARARAHALTLAVINLLPINFSTHW